MWVSEKLTFVKGEEVAERPIMALIILAPLMVKVGSPWLGRSSALVNITEESWGGTPTNSKGKGIFEGPSDLQNSVILRHMECTS